MFFVISSVHTNGLNWISNYIIECFMFYLEFFLFTSVFQFFFLFVWFVSPYQFSLETMYFELVRFGETSFGQPLAYVLPLVALQLQNLAVLLMIDYCTIACKLLQQRRKKNVARYLDIL